MHPCAFHFTAALQSFINSFTARFTYTMDNSTFLIVPGTLDKSMSFARLIDETETGNFWRTRNENQPKSFRFSLALQRRK